MDEQATDREMFKFSEVLSALSLVLDRVEGQPEGHVVRSCFVGMTIGEGLGLAQDQRSALFYALLLKDAGCSSTSSGVAGLFEADDFEVKKTLETTDRSRRLPESFLYVARTVSPGGNLGTRARRFLAVGMERRRANRRLVRIRCERGAEIARLIGFPEATVRAIRSLDEHWEGTGYPDGLRGEEIPLLSRVCKLAQTVDFFYTAFGPSQAEEVARNRRARWFDPALVDIFLAKVRAGSVWERMADPDLLRVVSRLEPADRVLAVTPERLDLTARAFVRIIDAKSPFTYRHSERVAETATAMAEHIVLPTHAVRDQGRTGLLYNIGKLAISNRILDKPGPLTQAEYAQVKKHPGLTYEVLTRVAHCRGIAEVAASHHEKLDGTGYHRGVTAEDLSVPSRILASLTSSTPSPRTGPIAPPCPWRRYSPSWMRRVARNSVPGVWVPSTSWHRRAISEVEQQLHRRSRKRRGQRSHRSSHAMPQ
jgi:HD-GYP domain-containing protein (c-di-GMP phosphodiesterase class II)